MITPLILTLSNASKTRSAGGSLARSLYRFPVDILLTGEVGAGKTTFLQGFAEELGISDPITSPTYALEQRYETKKGIPFIHIDLYRLHEKGAVELLDATDEHEGIRCIEWANIAPQETFLIPTIHLHFEELADGRSLKVTFNDCAIPTQKQIDDWRVEAMLPPHITAHCEMVAHVAGLVCDAFIERGEIVRKDATVAAAKLHDLLRFFDFKAKAPQGMESTAEEQERWDTFKKRYPNMRHEDACGAFLREQNFPEIGEIVEPHGLQIPILPLHTTEQKIVFYADKRVMENRIVTVQERFDDFVVRYANGAMTDTQKLWLAEAKRVENELFPEGAPLFI